MNPLSGRWRVRRGVYHILLLLFGRGVTPIGETCTLKPFFAGTPRTVPQSSSRIALGQADQTLTRLGNRKSGSPLRAAARP